MKEKLKVALAGNPNSGKSSLFNSLTGLKQKVGNYPGITVDKKTGRFMSGITMVELTDLPGTYSIYPRTDDEQIVSDVLIDKHHPDHPDLVIVVVDASNLKRNLLLATQVIDLKIPVIIALNMMDIAEKDGLKIDEVLLEKMLGVRVIKMNARLLKGIDRLKNALKSTNAATRSSLINIADTFPANYSGPTEYAELLSQIGMTTSSKANKLNKDLLSSDNTLSVAGFQAREVLARYKAIGRILDACLEKPEKPIPSITQKLDAILTHRIWGFFIFIGLLFLIFQSIFTLAEYPMSLVESGTAQFSKFLFQTLPGGWLTNLLVNGVIAGIGGVVIFIPQIAILFGFLTILEDTGYMARVSFITDKLMRGIGLNGKSVIPLMSGLACAIPAIMATRNIQSWKERLVTIMITPLISCSARLPVFILIIGIAVPDKSFAGIINFQGLTLLSLYLLGVVMAVIVAFVLQFLIKKREASIFILELPIYRPPRWRNVLVTMYDKSKIFTFEAGKVILIISIILWFLASYGPADFGWGKSEDAITIEQAEGPSPVSEESLALRNSFAGEMGRFIEPIIRPLGFDWKIGISLITSFAAREVFVGTMATMYSVESGKNNFDSVRNKMTADINPETGKPVFNTATAFSLLIFFAFAMQCMSTLAVVKRETKSWKWPMIQLVYLTALAYVASFVTYQVFS